MQNEHRQSLIATYRDGLLNDTLPFWIKCCVDREHGGFMFCRDRDGSLLDTDKSVWIHGRFTWLLASLYNTVQKKDEWRELARHGLEYLLGNCFDTDGRMFFLVTREGAPIRKRRYVFSEAFGCMAIAACAKAFDSDELASKARDLFALMLRYLQTPGLLEPKSYPQTRASKGLAVSMILIATAQIMRENLADQSYTSHIDGCIDEIERDFMKPQFKAAMESVGPEGEFLDHFDGRMLCPGHAIEAAWFIMHEGRVRGDDRLVRIGTTILDWMWDIGWDEQHGGIMYYRDVKGLPVQEYWHDMKFWWPHNETIIATLLAYHLTGNRKYLDWHGMVHDWAYSHFPDKEYGEWYGYLHRDGRISTQLKGNHWKGPYHLPRMQLYCWKLLEEGCISAIEPIA